MSSDDMANQLPYNQHFSDLLLLAQYIAHIALGCTERRWTSDRGARAASAGHFTSPAGTLSVTLRATSEIKIKI